jgi:hypothetical protein
VPDGATIPPPMLKSIEAFTVYVLQPIATQILIFTLSVLDEIRCNLEDITLAGWLSRVVHLRRNERTVQDMKTQLADVYQDFLVRLFTSSASLFRSQSDVKISPRHPQRYALKFSKCRHSSI